MKHSRIIIAVFVLIAAILACATLPPASTPDVNAIVTQTIQALTSNAPVSSPTPSLLPRSLYFINKDAAAHTQVYRLTTDGKTVTQITFEPTDVSSYDVNPNDGRVVYVSNNQLLLIRADGSGRQVLLDGGPIDPNNPYLVSIQFPVWSPNGQTIAYGYGGLNLYAVATGVSNRVLENKVDHPTADTALPGELYWPERFSPDGTKLLVTIGYMEGGTFAIYYPSTNTLIRLAQSDSGNICCGARWTPDSASLYAALPTNGMFSSGLWRIDAASGNVTTLLPGDTGNGSINFADAPQIGPDGQLYFFFASTPPGSEFVMSAPMQLVRSAPDGVTGRTVLIPEPFKQMTEALWSPDTSFVIVVTAPNDQVFQGGRAEIVYVDGRSRVEILPFAVNLRWGP
jgi:Tol biopolymer transport system component